MNTRATGIRNCTLGLAGLLAAVAFSTQLAAQAQCSGTMDTATDPNTFLEPLEFTGYPGFAEVVRITLSPGAGTGSADLTLNEVEYALACADNGLFVPCANGNDEGASSGVLPIEYVGNVDGTCGVTDGDVEIDAFGPGTLRFAFPEPQTFSENQDCSVNFDVRVRDIGSDSSPLELTGAVEAIGSCAAGALVGSARGSVSILLEDAPPPPPPAVAIPGPQGWWLVLMTVLFAMTAWARAGRA